MSKKQGRKQGRTHIIPIRLDRDVKRQVERLAGDTKLSEQDILRMALDRGLVAVKDLFESERSAKPEPQAA